MMRRGRLIAVLLALAGALSSLLAASQPWATLVLTSSERFDIAGSLVAPGLVALALAALALALAITLAGPFLRVVVALLALVLGAVLAVHALASDAVAAAREVAVEHTGIDGAGLDAEIATITTTAWPWPAVLGGALVIAAGVSMLATMRRWPTRAARRAVRYEREDSGLAWDAQDAGDDPTSRAIDEADGR